MLSLDALFSRLWFLFSLHRDQSDISESLKLYLILAIQSFQVIGLPFPVPVGSSHTEVHGTCARAAARTALTCRPVARWHRALAVCGTRVRLRLRPSNGAEGDTLLLVWLDTDSSVAGFAPEPIYQSAPQAVKEDSSRYADSFFYELIGCLTGKYKGKCSS